MQKWLDELKQFDTVKFKIVELVLSIVFKVYPKVLERIIYGGIMFSLEKDFGGLFVSKYHVSFEFGEGSKMTDLGNFLEGTGKFRRHLKLKSSGDVKDKGVSFFVAQAVR